jgi:signal transduction histidine kinase
MKILHLEDAELDHILAKKALSTAGVDCSWIRVETVPQFTQQCIATSFDLILADYQLPGFTAIDAWHAFPDGQIRPPFVLFSGAIGEAAAVKAVKLGFADYLSKSEGARLARVVQRALEFDQNLKAKAAADEALAISKRRLTELNEHLQSIIENERKAISREIHDDIGGALAAAKLDLAWMLRRDIGTELQSHANAAQNSLQSAIDACRRIMLNLRPSILDDGLQAAVEWLVDGFSRRNAIKVRLRVEKASTAVNSDVLLVAFRFAQEALTNITKHANCTAVTIDVSSHEGFLTLEVSDNGRGMTQEDQLKTQSFGLRGLQERAQSVGGWLDVSSMPGHGTSLVLSIPLDGQSKTAGEDHS